MILYVLVLVVHVLLSFLLIGVILLQGGRGSLGETLGGGAAQSLFGGGANTVMTKITAIGAGLFMTTCLSLAILSTARGRSIVEQLPSAGEQLPITLPTTSSQIPTPSAAPASQQRSASPRPSATPTPPTQHEAPSNANSTTKTP